MNHHTFSLRRSATTALALLLALSLPHTAIAKSKPKVDDSETSQALEEGGVPRIKRKVSVTVYEVRSGVDEVNVRAATEMFTTALVKSRRFRVVERSNMNAGLATEHQLNSSGATTGNVAEKQLRGAQLIFEAVISEANADGGGSDGGISIAGMTFGGNKSKGSIGMDVRVLDAGNGDVLDAVNVSKDLSSGGFNVSGIGAAVDTVIGATGGRGLGEFTPDGGASVSSNESVDKAVRALIELAVKELSGRSSEWFE